MKETLYRVFFVAACFVGLAHGQTATFTWNGSTDSSQLTELATINSQPVNQATGYGGAIQIVNGQFLWELELPQSLGFANGGFSVCNTPLTFGAKQWGTRVDGTTMDGTKAGDSYTINASTPTSTCESGNGAGSISLIFFREMIQHHSCYRVCRTWLVDTMESGSGSAIVQ